MVDRLSWELGWTAAPHGGTDDMATKLTEPIELVSIVLAEPLINDRRALLTVSSDSSLGQTNMPIGRRAVPNAAPAVALAAAVPVVRSALRADSPPR
jgi:hypothetical protein